MLFIEVAEVLVPRHGSRLRQYAEAIIRSQEYRQTGMFTNNFVTDASNMVNWHAGRLERAEFTADLLAGCLGRDRLPLLKPKSFASSVVLPHQESFHVSQHSKNTGPL